MQKIFISLLLFSLTACAQTTPGTKIKPDIRNTKTNKHVSIPGTRLYIIPPPNFNVSKTFMGLQKGDKSFLTIYDLIGGNFYTNAGSFSKAAFEQKGAKVFDYQEIKVNGYPAKYISMQGDPGTKAYALVFGDTTFSTMIMAACPAMDEATGKEIISALNTIYYDKSRKINPFETAFFSLDDSNSKFKFFQFNASLYMYTVGGTDNTKDSESPYLLVVQFPMDKTMTTKSVADMLIGKAQQYGLTNLEVKNVSTDKINGYDTYEAEVHGQIKGAPSVLYQCVITKGDKIVAMQGIAKNDMDANIAEFKKLVRTVRLK